LAEKTGWSEHFILWELPLRRLYQYYHVALRSSDLWTVIPMPPAASMAQQALLAVEAVHKSDIQDISDDPED
jgi:hypothetical protein